MISLPINLKAYSANVLIKTEQNIYFPDVVQFFKNKDRKLHNIPKIVMQMNLFLDEDLIIRVKSKFISSEKSLILLHYNSYLFKLIIRDTHQNFSHGGIYIVLRELRKKFWLLRGFSTVRKVLSQCVTCKRLNERPIKNNQNDYRTFRYDPPKIPFSFIFLDYIGPINVRLEGTVKKMYLLIITCLWSRAISLQITFSADTGDFLRCLQLHIYSHGLFQLCLSDLGSQITAGAKLISNFLDDINCIEFFESHGISKVKFDHYPKGNSELGSLVENCVKQVKALIIKSIGKVILDYPSFQLLISKTNHVINRRPVAFKEALRDSNYSDDVPVPITPEMLLYGRELISLDIWPEIQSQNVSVGDFNVDCIKNEYKNLLTVNKRLVENYSNQFLTQLISQAVDKSERYKPVMHKKLSVGSIVLLIEPHTKRSNYPMGIIKKLNFNSLGEVTSALIMKGKNRETVFRHSSSIIPLLEVESDADTDGMDGESSSSETISSSPPIPYERTLRKSSATARKNIQSLIADDLI